MSTLIAVLTLLRASICQVPDADRSFRRYIETRPTLDTRDNALSCMRLTGRMRAGKAMDVIIKAELYEHNYKLIILDSSDMTPLLIFNDGQMLYLDTVGREFVFGDGANCSLLLERRVVNGEGKFAFEFGANWNQRSRVGQESLFRLDFASLFYDEQGRTFTQSKESVAIVRQRGKGQSMIEGKIDFSSFCIFKELHVFPVPGIPLLSLLDIDVNYNKEWLLLPDLSSQARHLENECKLVRLRAGEDNRKLLSAGDFGRSCMARLATRMTDAKDRKNFMDALILNEDDIDNISLFDKKYSGHMRRIVSGTPGGPERQKTEQKKGRR